MTEGKNRPTSVIQWFREAGRTRTSLFLSGLLVYGGLTLLSYPQWTFSYFTAHSSPIVTRLGILVNALATGVILVELLRVVLWRSSSSWRLRRHFAGVVIAASAVSVFQLALAPFAAAKSAYRRGASRLQLADHEGAIAEFTRAIQSNPKYVDAYVGRGDAHAHRSDFDAALSDLNQAIALDPEHPTAYYHRCWTRGEQRDYDAAIVDCTSSIEKHPEHLRSYLERAWARRQNGDLDGSIADLDRAVALGPQNDAAFESRGWSHFYKRDYRRAIEDWRKALDLAPGNAARLEAPIRDAEERLKESQSGRER